MTNHHSEVLENTGKEILVRNKVLYHGSVAGGIKDFKPAEESTVGSGFYLTPKLEDAVGYAKRRSRKSKDLVPTVYKGEINNLKLVNLETDENVREVLSRFRAVLAEQTYDKWYTQNAQVLALTAISEGKVGADNLRTAVFAFTDLFTQFLRSQGYDGLIALEGGEGEDVGEHETYLIFDPQKVKILEEIPVNQT